MRHPPSPLSTRLVAASGVVVIALALSLGTPRPVGAAPVDPIDEEVAKLTPLVNLGVPIDVSFDPPPNTINDVAYPSVRGRSTWPEINANDALAYAWITGTASGALGVVTDIALPPAINAWDCSHSLVSYGLWIRRTREDPWSHFGSGTFYGFWKEGSGCLLNNGPENIFKFGSTITVFGSPDGGLVFQYLLGVKKWAHNDPSLGHSGRCREVDCYYAGKVRVAASKH